MRGERKSAAGLDKGDRVLGLLPPRPFVLIAAFLLWSGVSPAVGQRPAASASPGEGARDAQALEDRAQQQIAGGHHRGALATLDQAQGAYRHLRDDAGLTRVALKRASAYVALNNLAEAERLLRLARKLAPDAALRVAALTQHAALADSRADPAAAAPFLQEALTTAGRARDPLIEVRVLQGLGRNAGARGQPLESLDYASRAIAAADKAGDLALRSATRGNRSVTLLGLGRYDEALADAQGAWDIVRDAKDVRVRASALFTLAQTHNHLWNLDRAAALWTETIGLYREMKSDYGVGVSMRQRVETWFALGNFDRAVKDGEEAVALLEKAGAAGLTAETLGRMALSDARRRRWADAARYAERARGALARTPHARHVFVENDLGLVSLELSHPAQARAHFTRVLELAREVHNPEYVWRAHHGLGRAALAEGRARDAMPDVEAAVASVERLRQMIPEAGQRAAFMTGRVGPHETLVQALIAQSAAPGDAYAVRAFEVAERARGRALADLLAEARARLTEPRVARIRDEEAAFGRRLSALQQRLLQTPERARGPLEAELDTLERDFEAHILRIRRAHPNYAALAYPQPRSAAEVSALLEPADALVEFLLTRDEGFAWIARHDRVQAYRVPGPDSLEAQVQRLQAVARSGDEEAAREIGAHLYRVLLEPAKAHLRGVRRLIIVADGPLQRLPFALLRTRAGWLIETHAISMAPSATVLAHLRSAPRQAGRKPLLAFAASGGASTAAAGIFDRLKRRVTPLLHADREVRSLANIAGAGADAVRLGDAAGEASLKGGEPARYRIIHFAAHAVVDEAVPRRSALVLGGSPDGRGRAAADAVAVADDGRGANEDGLLQLNEIANLTLSADLVVLAACESHVGRAVRGEGLLSLSRAFMHAGARAVVATLWTVADRETRFLMTAFYAALARGAAPDEALRAAQLQMLGGGGRTARLVSWAPFVVTGDVRLPVFDAPPRAKWAWVRPAWVAGCGAGAIAGAGLVMRGVRRRKTRSAN